MSIKLYSRPRGMYSNPVARRAFLSQRAIPDSTVMMVSTERLKTTLFPFKDNANIIGYGIYSRVYSDSGRITQWSKENRQAIYTSNKIGGPTYVVPIGAFGKPICLHSPILYSRPVDRVFKNSVLLHQVQVVGLLTFAQRRKWDRK